MDFRKTVFLMLMCFAGSTSASNKNYSGSVYLGEAQLFLESSFEKQWIRDFEEQAKRLSLRLSHNLALYKTTQQEIVAKDIARNNTYRICEEIYDCTKEHIIQRLRSIDSATRLLKLSEHTDSFDNINVKFKSRLPKDQAESCFSREIYSSLSKNLHFIPSCWSKTKSKYDEFKFDIEVSVHQPRLSLISLYLDKDGCIHRLNSSEKINKFSPIKLAMGSGPPMNKSEHLVFIALENKSGPLAELEANGFSSCQTGAFEVNQLLDIVFDEKARKYISTHEIQVVANQITQKNVEDIEIDHASGREYTLSDFDIRPYLPDEKGNELYRVLSVAHKLTNRIDKDGVRYKQHSWSKSSDDENLDVGIDCSRAIWFSFTRAKIPYSMKKSNISSYLKQPYLHTGAMVSKTSKMASNFKRCDKTDYQIGDVLVYRNSDLKIGHTVMVIDPKLRIAWGSHGWDGQGKMPNTVPDNGAEYQVIKFKKDWRFWDKQSMELKACWRHLSFSQIASSEFGNMAIKNCDFELKTCS